MRALPSFLIVVAFAITALPARAQVDPSVADIIHALKPQTRGIHPAKPGAEPNAPPEPQTGDAAPSYSLTVEFATDSIELTPRARQTLDKLGRALTSRDLTEYRFRLEGHTDTVGSASYNLTLSQRRADAVAGYLMATFGVQATRLLPVGLGEQGLAVSTPPQTPNAQNRRVKVVNLGT